MSGCDLGGAHKVAISIQDIDPFFQLPIPHQDHVADIGTGWRERREQGTGVKEGGWHSAWQRRPIGSTLTQPPWPKQQVQMQ